MEAFLDEAFSSSEGRKEQEKQFPAWWCSYSRALPFGWLPPRKMAAGRHDN